MVYTQQGGQPDDSSVTLLSDSIGDSVGASMSVAQEDFFGAKSCRRSDGNLPVYPQD